MEPTTEQKQAIESRGMSVAVSAAAGSGKTAVLTRRIIERVCAPDGDISRILAVTYTKAAAAEIVSRLSKALSEKLASDPSNRHIARQSLLVSSAKISTVHHFCLDVIRDDFERLSLPSDFSAGDANKLEILSRKVMDKLIDDYFEGNVCGDEKIDDFALFSDTFGSPKSTDALIATALKIYEKLSCKAKFIDALDENIQMYKNVNAANFLDSPWGVEIIGYTRALFLHYEKELSDALEAATVNDDYLPAAAALSYDHDFASYVLSKLGAADYRELSGIINGYAPPKLTFKRGAVLSPEMEFFKAERGNFKDDVRKAASAYYSFSEREIEFTFAETAKRISEMKTFLKAFDRRYREEKTRRHVISFSDMEHYALQILWDRENDAPSDAARRIRDGFDEIFIDEYQDTNEVQDKIFSLISKENNVFCVGDVKQSIYGYRGAESRIFEKILDGRKKYEEGTSEQKAKIFLSKNFRSSNEIIDFCNGVFGKILNVVSNKYGDDEKLNAGLGISCGDVEIAVLPKGDADELSPEAQFVARRVAALIEGGRKMSDIAILLRGSKHAADYERALKMMNIPVKNTMDSDFFESGEVLLMLSLLNVIDNPARDVYLAATLKSRLFGVTLDELIYIRRSGEGTLYDALCKFTEKTGFQKGKRFLGFLDKFRALVPSLPCDKLIWQIYIETDILSLVGTDGSFENYEAEQAKANLIQLYNYSRQFGANSYRGLYDFISFINDVIEQKETVDLSQFKTAGDAVSIMTIHSSKGLEFPVCIISDTGAAFNDEESRSSAFYGKLGISTRLYHPSGFGKIKTPAFTAALIPEWRVKLDEEVRILYVALTRAREKLIITATSSRPDELAGGGYDMRARYFSEYALMNTKKFIDLVGVGCAGRSGYSVVSDNGVLPAPKEKKSVGGENITPIEARRLVVKRLNYEYPHAALTRVPAKVAVSELYPDLLDEGEEEIKEASFDYVPRFLAGTDDDATAAERGTATHTFMQFFDFDRVEKNGVRAEIEYLAERKFIFDADVPKIDVRGAEMFFRSELAKKIKSAKEVWREKRFILSFDADEFTKDETTRAALKGEKLLVQGVIDCAYRDGDGKIVVIDYKTDHFKRGTPRAEIESVLRERHTRQLMYYKKACEMLFGEVSRVLIYSFAINGTVEIYGGQK